MLVDYERDAWLSGFVDGEGHFGIIRKHPYRRRDGTAATYGAQPIFNITLRADDIAVLEALKGAFGGRIAFNASTAGSGNRKPRYSWTVSAKADLAKLIAYFDAYPLRAKKARDYGIWRQAAMAYIREGSQASELPALREALMTVRIYEEPEHRQAPTDVTFTDVAVAAGVAQGTAERAYHEPHRVRPETRMRILAAANEVGYAPRLRAV